jgi:hypothetical protein
MLLCSLVEIDRRFRGAIYLTTLLQQRKVGLYDVEWKGDNQMIR